MTQDFPEEFGGHSDPIEIFKLWFDEAHKTQLKNPNAFVLSTVDPEGQPRSRVLLCKEVRDNDFVFYTNYNSAKGQQLSRQPHACMNFYWDALFRQVKITGKVSKMKYEDSLKYWETRDRASQLSQWVSKQSQALTRRAEMEEAVQKAEAEFEGKAIPCPENWGGYTLHSASIEFWVGRSGRFHDRFIFQKQDGDWSCVRLYP